MGNCGDINMIFELKINISIKFINFQSQAVDISFIQNVTEIINVLNKLTRNWRNNKGKNWNFIVYLLQMFPFKATVI